MPKGAQSDGISKTLLSQQIPLYEAMGRTRVDVHANIDVGGYAWGRYGFVPNQADWDAMRSYIPDQLDEVKNQIPAATHDHLLAAANHPDPKAMWQLVDDRTPITTRKPGTEGQLPHDMSDADVEWNQMLAKLRAQSQAGLEGLPVPGFTPPQRATRPITETQSLGKHLFLGSNWRGSMDLNDNHTHS